MPQFPLLDQDALAQALKTFITQRQNVPALSSGGSTDYTVVVNAWAEALTTVQNPTIAYQEANINALYTLVAQQQSSGSGTLLFNAGSPLLVGQWVYLISVDTVDAVDSTNSASGPAIGVVVSLPTASTVSVRNFGSFLYNSGMSYPFVPLVPDTIYYAGTSGNITASPNPGSGGFVQELGYAKTAYEFVLNIQEPILV